jgi:hypothetical protein
LISNKSDLKNILPIMEHRVNWKFSTDKSKFNFLWKYSTKKINYSEYNQNSTKLINLFEFHEEMTTKRSMFLNLLTYSNVRKIKLESKFQYIFYYSYDNHHVPDEQIIEKQLRIFFRRLGFSQ